jgi:hypothetical protein
MRGMKQRVSSRQTRLSRLLMLSSLSFAGARVHKKPKFPSMLKTLDAGGKERPKSGGNGAFRAAARRRSGEEDRGAKLP